MEAIVIIVSLMSVGAYGAVRLQPHLKRMRRKLRPRSSSRRRPSRSRTAKREKAHDYQKCQDGKCKQKMCQVFREGQRACPLPHQG